MKSFILNNSRSILLAGLMLFFSSLGLGQSTSDIAKGSNAVKVIDNKGTIKYLQSSNGITTLTNTTSDVTTTTWQLGGTLTDDTYIDVDGNVFALDGIDITTVSASTNAISDDDAQSGSPTGSGYTLLVRNEATGAIEKLKVSELMITGGHHVEVLTSDTSSDLQFAVSGVSTDYKKVSVYRNGAKLVGGDTSSTWTNDYSVATDQVTINVGGTGELSTLYTTDVIEVQWVK